MTASEITLSAEAQAFVDKAKEEAALAFEVFRDTGIITPNGTVGFIERIPGENKIVSFGYPGPWNRNKPITPRVSVLGATRAANGNGPATEPRYNKLFEQHPDVTTVSHVHSNSLGAWAQTHRTLQFNYVPVQRFQLARELPVYIDRRQAEVDFILDSLKANPHTPAILEANGGATVWGTQGLRKTAEFILLLEEGARLQILAESIGGSRSFGPGVLAQQWKMSKLYDKAKSLNLLPATDL